MKLKLAMSVIFSILVFRQDALTSESVDTTAECKVSEHQKCDEPTDKKKAEKDHDENSKDWSHKRHKQVAKIFPELLPSKMNTIRPNAVQLNAPAFLAKVSAQTVKLEWVPTGGALNYHLQVSKDAGFNNRSMYVAEDKNVTATSFDLSNLEPGVKYFWRVAAYNKNQDSQYTKSKFVSSVFETE